MACPKALHVNSRLLPTKLAYLFVLGGVASLLPYIAIYMKQVGLSPMESSIVYGVMPFIGAIVRILVGILADKKQIHKLCLIMCCVLTGILHAFLLYIPEPPSDLLLSQSVPVTLNCDPSGGRVSMCASASLANDSVEYSGESHWDPLHNATNCSLLCDANAVAKPRLCVNSSNVSSTTSDTHPICFPGSQGYPSQAAQSDTNVYRFERLLYGDVEHTSVSETSPVPHQVTCAEYDIMILTYSGTPYGNIYCPQSGSLSCHMFCSPNIALKKNMELLKHEDVAQSSAPFGKNFWYFLWIFFLGQMAFAPVFSLCDALVYGYLGKESGKWGQQRLWGTVGFAVLAVLSGLIMDISLADGGRSKFIYAFSGYAICMVAAAVVVYFFGTLGNVKSTNMARSFGSLCRRLPLLLVFVHVFVYGANTGVTETFLYWHLETIGGTKLLFGLCLLFNCIPEIIFLFLAGKIIKLLGHFTCLSLVYVAYVCRFVVYAYVQNPWYVLLVEPLHGITFGLMYAAASGYANDHTPAGMQGTVQSVIGAVHFGFGKGIGSIVGGQIFQFFGPFVTFISVAVTNLVMLLVYIGIHFTVIRRGPHGQDCTDQQQDEEPKEREMNALNPDTKEPTASEQANNESPTNTKEQETLLTAQQTIG